MTITYSYLGCDVSMRTLDIFDPTCHALQRVDNTAEAIRSWLATCDPATTCLLYTSPSPRD